MTSSNYASINTNAVVDIIMYIYTYTAARAVEVCIKVTGNGNIIELHRSEHTATSNVASFPHSGPPPH